MPDAIDDFFAGVPSHTPPRPRRRKNKKPELAVQNQIIRWLLVERHALVAVTDAGALNRLGLGMSCGIPKGWPDLTCCVPPHGTFLGVECKAPNGRMSDDQKLAETKIIRAGGMYILASSLEEFIRKFQECY